MKSLKKFKDSVPPRARAMMILTVILVGGMVYFGLSVIGGSGEGDDGPGGSARVSARPDTSQIDRADPSEADNVPEGSPLAEELERIREARIEAAQRGEDSFIDPLELGNLMAAAEEREPQEESDSEGDTEERPEEEPEPEPEPEPEDSLREPQPDRAERAAPREASSQQLAQRSQDINRFLERELEAAQQGSGGMEDAVSAVASRQLSDRPVLASSQSGDGGRDRASGSGQEGGNGGSGGTGSFDRFLAANGEGPSDEDLDRGSVAVDPEGNPIPRGEGSQDELADQGYPRDREARGTTREGDGEVLANAGHQVYGYLLNESNSDEPGPIFATVLQDGPLEGARLIGSEPQLVGEKLILRFETMALDGETYSIDALATKPGEWTTRLADDVDRHVFERYFKLTAAAFASGYVDALAGSTTTINSDGSQTTNREPLPDSGDQALSAVGTVGEKLLPKYEDYFDRPPTVRVYGDRPVGIVFMQPVRLTDSE